MNFIRNFVSLPLVVCLLSSDNVLAVASTVLQDHNVEDNQPTTITDEEGIHLRGLQVSSVLYFILHFQSLVSIKESKYILIIVIYLLYLHVCPQNDKIHFEKMLTKSVKVKLDNTFEELRLKDKKRANLVKKYHPLFDFDGDGCLPDPAIYKSGAVNGGLNPSGSITGGCRAPEFLDSSNTYFRWYRYKKFHFHMYALYFEKDQATAVGGGH